MNFQISIWRGGEISLWSATDQGLGGKAKKSEQKFLPELGILDWQTAASETTVLVKFCILHILCLVITLLHYLQRTINVTSCATGVVQKLCGVVNIRNPQKIHP